MASRRRFPLQISCPRTTIAAALACHLTCILLLAGSVYALDPNKRVTQYMHTAWRTQDGSLPTGMHEIKQTSDGFLWLVSLPGDIYRFDGVRFVPGIYQLAFRSKARVMCSPTTRVGSG